MRWLMPIKLWTVRSGMQGRAGSKQSFHRVPFIEAVRSVVRSLFCYRDVTPFANYRVHQNNSIQWRVSLEDLIWIPYKINIFPNKYVIDILKRSRRITVFLDLTQYNLVEIYRHFRGRHIYGVEKWDRRVPSNKLASCWFLVLRVPKRHWTTELHDVTSNIVRFSSRLVTEMASYAFITLIQLWISLKNEWYACLWPDMGTADFS